MIHPSPASHSDPFRPVRLKHVMREVRRPVLVDEEVIYREIGVRSHGRGVFHKEPISGHDLGDKRVFWIQPGLLVFNIVFAWEGAVAVLSDAEAGMIASHRFPMYSMLPGRGDAAFMKYFFTTQHGLFLLQDNSPGAAGRNKTLNQSKLLAEEVRLPPAYVQRAIADFLDRRTAAIDALIEKKERLVALLAEKRAALIHRAVTRGLDPDAPMKDSGVPWIGEVPAHWKVVALKRLLSDGPRNGLSPQMTDAGVGLRSFSISAIRSGELDIQDANIKFVDAPDTALSVYDLRADDVLLVRGNGNIELVGRAGLVRQTISGFIYPDILMRLRFAERRTAGFMTLFINSPSVREQVELAARTTVGTFKVNNEQVRELLVAEPPIAEAILISQEVDRIVALSMSLEDALQRQLTHLHEYRQCLITAAVTGQIDVRSDSMAEEVVS